MAPRSRTRFSLCLGAAAALTAAGLVYTGWLSRIDLAVYDLQLSVFQRPPPEDVVLVEIDNASIEAIGRWPWSRGVYADLLDRLSEAGARAVVIDVLFSDANADDAEGDHRLAQAMARYGRAVLPVGFGEIERGGPAVELAPTPELAKAAARLGHVDVDVDRDGLVRRVFLYGGVGTASWPTLALAALSAGGASTPVSVPQPATEPAAAKPFHWVRSSPRLITFAGPSGSFRRASFADVLRGEVPQSLFRDAFVLVGATDSGLGDRFSVPVSGNEGLMSGVELNANVLDGMRRGLLVESLRMHENAALMALLALVAVLGCGALRPVWAGVLIGPVFVIVASAAMLYFAHAWLVASAGLVAVELAQVGAAVRERRLRHAAVRAERRRAAVAMKSVADAVVVLAPDDTIRDMNPVAEALTGVPLADARGRPVDTVVQLFDEQRSTRLTMAMLLAESSTIPEHKFPNVRNALLQGRDGEQRSVRLAISLIDGPGEPTETIVAFTDLTGLERMAQLSEHQATRDDLTRLPSRKRLRERLGRAIGFADSVGMSFALLIIDIDRFETVNDDHGHAAGDALLSAVADRLSQHMREWDWLARSGGDEFAVILGNLGAGTGVAFLAHRLRKALSEPFTISGVQLSITVSIGACLYPRDGHDAETLLAAARWATSDGARRGGNRLTVYPKQQEARDVQRLRLLGSFQRALAEGDVFLHYQPLIDLHFNAVVGCEALLRWNWPYQGTFSPDKIIPLAEETELIHTVGTYVLDVACRQMSTWDAQGLPPFHVSVNLSARQFLDPTLCGTIERLLADNKLSPERLVLEITEGTITADMAGVCAAMQALSSFGVHVFLDDFGIGYSSLTHLKTMPIRGLKIDKSFVHDALTSARDAALTTAIVVMAHAMRMRVIAEGIEMPEQLEFVRAHDCDEAQGYLLAPPLASEDVGAFLRSGLSRAVTGARGKEPCRLRE